MVGREKKPIWARELRALLEGLLYLAPSLIIFSRHQQTETIHSIQIDAARHAGL